MKQNSDQHANNVRELLWAHGISVGEYAEKTDLNRVTIIRRADLLLQMYNVDEKDFGSENVCEILYGPLRLAENLQYLMEKEGVLMVTLASAVGVSTRSVRRWVHGKKRPQPYHLRQLAEVFGLNPLKLQYGNPENGFEVRGAA